MPSLQSYISFFLPATVGLKSTNGIWKKINRTVVGQNAKVWQAESIKSKLAITIILENKAFIFVSGE